MAYDPPKAWAALLGLFDRIADFVADLRNRPVDPGNP